MRLLTKTSRKTDSSLPEITLPDEWNRLSRRQLLYLAWLFKQSIDVHHFKVLALNKLSGLKVLNRYYIDDDNRYRFLVKHKRRKFYVSAALYHELLKAVGFVMQEPKLTKQLIKSFWFGRRFHGPDDSCYNITYNELIHAELAWTNFKNSGDVKELNKLVAVLYRPRRKGIRTSDPEWDGDLREPFSAYTYTRRARWFRFLPFKLKYAVHIWFSGCIGHMADEHPLCFNSTRISSQPGKQNPAKALIDLVPVLTKADPTKNKALYASPAWDVFDAYESMRKEHEEMKKAHKKKK